LKAYTQDKPSFRKLTSRKDRFRKDGGCMLAHLDFWDYMTFASLFIVGAAAGGAALLVLGLPGKIAIARKHPDADAVNLMGWVGFLAVIPWIQALIWAFKPTDVIDIRRFPRQEQAAIDEDIMRLKGKPAPAASQEPTEGKNL
jgi:hypothetical protein